MKNQMGLMHPEVLMVGVEYPLSGSRNIASKVVSAAQIGLVIVGLGGSHIAAIRDHPLYQRFQEKKLFIFLGGYFMLNFLQTKISSTGAFEVFINDRQIYSKLALNRMPSMEEITSQIRH